MNVSQTEQELLIKTSNFLKTYPINSNYIADKEAFAKGMSRALVCALIRKSDFQPNKIELDSILKSEYKLLSTKNLLFNLVQQMHTLISMENTNIAFIDDDFNHARDTGLSTVTNINIIIYHAIDIVDIKIARAQHIRISGLPWNT